MLQLQQRLWPRVSNRSTGDDNSFYFYYYNLIYFVDHTYFVLDMLMAGQRDSVSKICAYDVRQKSSAVAGFARQMTLRLPPIQVFWRSHRCLLHSLLRTCTSADTEKQ